jgi:hypothetical protein
VTSTASDARTRPVDAIAGFLAASALFLGVLELAYRPFRLAPAAVILLLVATVMTTEYRTLIRLAFAAVGICFIAGAALQIITHHPLY